MSKIATLLLAKNYILMLQESLQEMRTLLSNISKQHLPGNAAVAAPDGGLGLIATHSGSVTQEACSPGITNLEMRRPNSGRPLQQTPAAYPIPSMKVQRPNPARLPQGSAPYSAEGKGVYPALTCGLPAPPTGFYPATCALQPTLLDTFGQYRALALQSDRQSGLFANLYRPIGSAKGPIDQYM